MTLKIVNVVGARPNLVKIAPLLAEMQRRPDIEPILIHTGQHYDDQLSDVFFRQLAISKPDFNLEVGSGSHAWQTAEVLRRIEPLLVVLRPDIVLLVGDVNSALAAALAAAKLGIPIAHVEAGLRSFDRTIPEEINRGIVDWVADQLFVTEDVAVANLLREGRPKGQIHLVGSVVIDALRQFLPIAQSSPILRELGLGSGNGHSPFAVLTLHRPSNVDSAETLTNLLSAIEELACKLPVIFPVHPRTRQRLAGTGERRHSELRLVPPIGYVDFIHLLSRARLVLTDSGGIQEETTALGVPCLTLRETTEQPVTVTEGTNHIVGQAPARIVTVASDILMGRAKRGRIPKLWDGHTSERIVDILLQKYDCLSPSRRAFVGIA